MAGSTDIPEWAQAEQAVLGSLLIDPNVAGGVSEVLDPSDFVLPNHQRIYAAMLRLQARSRPTDLVLVCDELGADLADAGGAAYLASMATLTPTSFHALHYASTVREASRRRLLMDLGQRMATGPVEDVDEAISSAESLLAEAKRKRSIDLWEDKRAFLDRLQERLLGPSNADEAGVLTGLHSLDHLVGGMRRGDLWILGARPSVGKTSMATTVAHHVGLTLGLPVAFFSAEMMRDRIFEKLLSLELGIPWRRLTSHTLTDQERARIIEGVAAVKEAPIDIVPAREWTIQQVRAGARHVHGQRPLSLVVVDYLQLIGVDRKVENRTQVISVISSNLKAMALELECPVLSASQLNRQPEQRGGTDPLMSELREGGSQEADSDVIVLLSYPEGRPTNDPVERIDVHVAKNRLGERGKMTLGLHGAFMRFVELSSATAGQNGHATAPALADVELGF